MPKINISPTPDPMDGRKCKQLIKLLNEFSKAPNNETSDSDTYVDDMGKSVIHLVSKWVREYAYDTHSLDLDYAGMEKKV